MKTKTQLIREMEDERIERLDLLKKNIDLLTAEVEKFYAERDRLGHYDASAGAILQVLVMMRSMAAAQRALLEEIMHVS